MRRWCATSATRSRALRRSFHSQSLNSAYALWIKGAERCIEKARPGRPSEGSDDPRERDSPMRRGDGQRVRQSGYLKAITIPTVTSITPVELETLGTSPSRMKAATMVTIGTVAVKSDTRLAPSRVTARV